MLPGMEEKDELKVIIEFTARGTGAILSLKMNKREDLFWRGVTG